MAPHYLSLIFTDSFLCHHLDISSCVVNAKYSIVNINRFTSQVKRTVSIPEPHHFHQFDLRIAFCAAFVSWMTTTDCT